jgi:gliding motility-associated-like protein
MYQYPHTGNGFCANAFYSNFGSGNRRGYIQTQLTQTLTVNKKYIVKFYVNLNNDSQYAVDKICALLTNTPIACNTGSFTTILVNPQIINKNGIITDTLNWIEVCDTMTAIGNEQYLIIGNFFSDGNTNISLSYPSGSEYIAHYNIDDVSVEEVTKAQCKNDTSICINDSVLVSNNNVETATYNWQPATGLSCGFCANPKASPQVTTKYSLTKQNCNIITKDSITITVKNDCIPKPIVEGEIPNVFTPNGDGINDTFNFSIAGVSDVSFMIYNRWGNIIKNSTLNTNNYFSWDGRTTSGEACSDGVYYYTLTYKLVNGDTETKKGFITLIR